MIVLLFFSAALAAIAQPVYSTDVAPILYQYCVNCHRANEAAPFPLVTYEDARKRAAQIAQVTRTRYMPPWPPEPGHGEFDGVRRLSPTQLDLLAKWAAAGAPLGDPTKIPTVPKFSEGWRLGPPDLIVKMSQPYVLSAAHGDVFRNFIVPAGLSESKYIRAVELHPGNRKVVHHANILIDRTQSLRARDGEDGQPGFGGMDVVTESGQDFEPDSHFLFWKPGTVAQPEPADMAWRLDPSTDLVVNLHLQPSGRPELIQAEIGLYFTSQAPTRKPILVQLEHDGAIDVAAGAKGVAVTDELVLPVAAQVLAVYPHAHYIGKEIEAWATLPSGKRLELLKISDWDINWQAAYSYKSPVELPAGSRLAMRITYDNTAANPRNPLKPPQRVRAGNRSEDEMGHVWFQLLPIQSAASPDPRMLIHLAMMQRRLAKYPSDFVAFYNLGAAYQYLEQYPQATQYLEKAVKMRPGSATARNTLGTTYMLTDHLDQAVAQFRAVLNQSPSYDSARFNLARSLAAQGDAAGAATEFEVYLARNAADGRGHQLAAANLASLGRIAEAAQHFRSAAKLDPKDADLQTNLGVTLAMQKDFQGAIAAFEQALAIQPDHKAALANLARARTDLAKPR